VHLPQQSAGTNYRTITSRAVTGVRAGGGINPGNEREQNTTIEYHTAGIAAHRSRNLRGHQSRLLFDNYAYRSPGEEQLGKDDFLRLVEAFPVKVTALWGEELRVNVYGETAIVTGIQLSKTRDSDGQEELTATSFSDVFIRRAGRWLLALTLATDLAEIPPQYRVTG
jgi:hypothetical protein